MKQKQISDRFTCKGKRVSKPLIILEKDFLLGRLSGETEAVQAECLKSRPPSEEAIELAVSEEPDGELAQAMATYSDLEERFSTLLSEYMERSESAPPPHKEGSTTLDKPVPPTLSATPISIRICKSASPPHRSEKQSSQELQAWLVQPTSARVEQKDHGLVLEVDSPEGLWHLWSPIQSSLQQQIDKLDERIGDLMSSFTSQRKKEKKAKNALTSQLARLTDAVSQLVST